VHTDAALMHISKQ